MYYIVQFRNVPIPETVPREWFVNGGTTYIHQLELRYITSLTLRNPVIVTAYGGDNGYVIYNLLYELAKAVPDELYKHMKETLLSDAFYFWYLENNETLIWRTKL
jgi:hypothetical protein